MPTPPACRCGEVLHEVREIYQRVDSLFARLDDLSERLPPAMATVKEAAKVLKCSEKTIRRLLDDKRIPHVWLGGTVRIDLSRIRAPKATR